MGLVPCIAVSTGYILLVLFLAELARRLVAPLNAGLVKTALNVRGVVLASSSMAAHTAPCRGVTGSNPNIRPNNLLYKYRFCIVYT